MKEGGFTLVTEGDDNIHSKKSKTDDGNHTTMIGIKREQADKIYQEYLKSGKIVDEEAELQQELEGTQKR